MYESLRRAALLPRKEEGPQRWEVMAGSEDGGEWLGSTMLVGVIGTASETKWKNKNENKECRTCGSSDQV